MLNCFKICNKRYENLPIIKNTKDILSLKIDGNIYLIQQYYIDKNIDRQNEIDECLRRNISNNVITRIYLLNEKIYYNSILDNDKIEQINIRKRLEFCDFFNFIVNLNGYCILSNSDIFFDNSLCKIRYGLLGKIRSVYCLTRYEYKSDDEISIDNEIKNYSQDTWILHSNNSDIENKDLMNYNLGKPQCDMKTAYILYKDGFTILNDMSVIKSYHYHNSNIRNYDIITDKVKSELLYIKPTI